jgi:hypothetical protein
VLTDPHAAPHVPVARFDHSFPVIQPRTSIGTCRAFAPVIRVIMIGARRRLVRRPYARVTSALQHGIITVYV